MTPPEHREPHKAPHDGPHANKGPDASKGPNSSKEPHANKNPQDHAAQRALNTPENATRAVATSRATIASLSPGHAWNHIAPRGEHELKGCLMHDGQPAAIFHFNPADASLLPRGLHALSAGDNEAIQRVETKLKSIAQELSVLEGAEFREPEFCWAVPLAHQGRIVGHIKVTADGSKIVADRKAIEEIASLKRE